MGNLYYPKDSGVALANAHELPHQLAGALHKPHQDQHIEQKFPYVIPNDGHRGKILVCQNRRGAGEIGEDHAAQHDDAPLQTNPGVAFEEALADAAGWLSGECRQRNRRNGRGDVEPEEPGIDGQNHDRGQHPDQKAAQ